MFEDEILCFWCEFGVEGEEFESAFVLDCVGVEHVYHAFDFFDGGEEDKDVSCWFFAVDVDDGLEDFEEVVAGGLAEVVDEDLVQSSGDIDPFDCEWFSLFFVLALEEEEVGDGLGVGGGGGDDDFEVVA